jgi:hypothetical protein
MSSVANSLRADGFNPVPLLCLFGKKPINSIRTTRSVQRIKS